MKNIGNNFKQNNKQKADSSFACSYQIRERKPGEKIDYYNCSIDYTACPNKHCIKNLV